MDKNRRIEYYDIAKGIGILLVVYAHTRGVSHYIYLFHVPLFFLISGLLYNEKSAIKDFVRRKIQSLYIPFVFWNLFFYIGKSFVLPDKTVSLKQVLLIVLTLSKDGQFCGATWFLGALFVTSVLYKILDATLKETKEKDFLLLISFGTLALAGFQITLPYMLSRTLILGFFFSVGAFVKKSKGSMEWMGGDKKIFVLFCVALFAFIGHYNRADMGKNVYTYPALFVIGAFAMSYALIYGCKLMAEMKSKAILPVKKVLIFWGRQSMDIVIWHFVFFRIGIIAQIWMNGEMLTIENILSYYPVYDVHHGWRLVYIFIGMVTPVLWCSFLRLGSWGRFFKKIHIV